MLSCIIYPNSDINVLKFICSGEANSEPQLEHIE